MPDCRLTRRDLAAACGVTPRTVTDWVAAGLPVLKVGRRLLFDAVAVIGWLAVRAVQQQGRMDLNQERAALARVQTERQGLALAKERGEVVGIQAAWDFWANHLLVARAHLLGLPIAVATECAATAEERVALQASATRVVRRVLTDLSKAPVLPPGAHDHDRSTDDDPMGRDRGQDRLPEGRPRRVPASDESGGAA